MITHRNAAMNTIGTLLHLPIAVGERYLWTLPMFHANGWTYTWTVTAAAGTHICLRKVDPATIFGLIRDEQVDWLCAAPTVLISLASAPAAVRGEVPSGVRVVTAGAPPAAATIERMEADLGWEVTQVYGLTETAPFITVCAPLPEHEGLPLADRAVIKARTGVELLTSGELRVVDPDAARGARRRADGGRDRRPRERRHGGLLPRPRGDRPGHGGRLVPHRRRGGGPPRRLRGDPRPAQGRDHQRRGEHLLDRGRGHAAAPPGDPGGRDRRPAAREVGRDAARLRGAARGRAARPRTTSSPSPGSTWPTSRRRAASPSSASCRRPRPGRSRSTSCGRARPT